MIAPILAVNDVDRSIAFYTEKLAFGQDFCLAGPDGQNAFAFVSLGAEGHGVAIGLSRQLDAPKGGAGVVFMVYVPPEIDLDDYYEAVRARGVAIDADIATQYWGDRSFTVRDPDGYILQISKTVEETDMEKVRAVMRGEA